MNISRYADQVKTGVAIISFTSNGAALAERIASEFDSCVAFRSNVSDAASTAAETGASTAAETGASTAASTAAETGASTAAVTGPKVPNISEWAGLRFLDSSAIIFIGALGIAVRAIAPHINHKTVDPAVICVDETGLFSISVLSGHLGGGNVIAQRVARVIGAQCVITTATDLRGVFGVDVWASEMGLHIENPDFIKRVSAALLGGKKVGIFIDGKWRGTLPKGLVLTDESGRLTGARKTGIPSVKECDVDVGADVEAEVDSKAEADVDNEAESDVKAEADSKAEADVDNEAEADVDVGVIVSCRSVNPYKYTLKLRPKAVTLGIGCKKGTDESEIVAAVNEFLVMNKFSIDSLTAVASISIKHDEPGILKFCEREKIDFFTYTSDELNEIAGEEFSYSDFVKKTANVDCVCERAAAAHGKLIIGKTVFKGITLALSMSDWGVAF